MIRGHNRQARQGMPRCRFWIVGFVLRGRLSLPSKVFAKPDFSLFGHINLSGAFNRVTVVTAILLIFSLLLSDFFDNVGTVTAIATEGGLIDKDGNVPNIDRILLVDGIAAVAGGAGNISSNTSYIESASGVGEGARTGLASIVTGILFLLTTFLAPLIAVIPYEAATPALIIVGFLMMTQIKNIDWPWHKYRQLTWS